MAPNKKFNTHHYLAGSENPIPKNDKITYINMRFCPFSHRTALLLIAKNVDFNIINVSLRKKPDWFLEANPLGLVPTLVLPDKASIIESTICSEYVDDAFGDNKLTRCDPMEKAQDKTALVLFESAIGTGITVIKSEPGTEKYDQAVEKHFIAYARLEKILKERNTKYFFGDVIPGMLDYMIWPTLERYVAMSQLAPVLTLDPERFPAMLAWRERMLQHPVVKEYLIPDDIYLEFFGLFAKGEKPDYDSFCKKLDGLA